MRSGLPLPSRTPLPLDLRREYAWRKEKPLNVLASSGEAISEGSESRGSHGLDERGEIPAKGFLVEPPQGNPRPEPHPLPSWLLAGGSLTPPWDTRWRPSSSCGTVSV